MVLSILLRDRGFCLPEKKEQIARLSLMILTENLLLMTMVQDISSGVAGMRDGFLRTGFIWMVSQIGRAHV